MARKRSKEARQCSWSVRSVMMTLGLLIEKLEEAGLSDEVENIESIIECLQQMRERIDG